MTSRFGLGPFANWHPASNLFREYPSKIEGVYSEDIGRAADSSFLLQALGGSRRWFDTQPGIRHMVLSQEVREFG